MTREAREAAVIAIGMLLVLAASYAFMTFFSRVDLDAPAAESE